MRPGRGGQSRGGRAAPAAGARRKLTGDQHRGQRSRVGSARPGARPRPVRARSGPALAAACGDGRPRDTGHPPGSGFPPGSEGRRSATLPKHRDLTGWARGRAPRWSGPAWAKGPPCLARVLLPSERISCAYGQSLFKSPQASMSL